VQADALSVDRPNAEMPPNSLPGIDIEMGMQRLGVAWESYKKMLLEFKRSQPAELNQLRRALNAWDYDTVRLKAHSLAGISGNIAADALKKAGKSLEKAAQLGNKNEIDARFTELREEFDRVIEGIATIGRTATAESGPTLKTNLDPGELHQLRRFLVDLEKYLADFDPVGAESARSRIDVTGVPAELLSEYEELSRNIRDLDYTAARAALTGMQRTLQDLMGKK
jgi:HPt (histidine-containing phosphotransfer) domain-containing protein